MSDHAEQDEEIPLAWTAMPYRVPVLDRHGHRIGTAESLEGDEDRDIFHGIAIKLDGAGRQLREIPADRITRITSRAVYTDLSDTDVQQLQPYAEERWFHLGWGGLFRKHPLWEEEGR